MKLTALEIGMVKYEDSGVSKGRLLPMFPHFYRSQATDQPPEIDLAMCKAVVDTYEV